MADSVMQAAAGGAGGMIAMSLTYPLNVISQRAAVQSKQEKTTLVQAAMKIVQKEGLGGLYSGLNSSLFGIAITNTIFYLFLEESKRMLLKAKSAKATTDVKLTISTLEMMLSSTIAGSQERLSMTNSLLEGAATTIATNPIWLIQTHQATRGAVETDIEAGKVQKRPLGMLESAQEIVREKGVKALWKGIGPSLILVINPVLQYTAFETLAKALAKWKSGRPTGSGSRVLSDFDMFYLGAISKLIATGITYPYLVVKSRLHASTHNYKSSWEGIKSILAEEGIAGLYRGIQAKLMQSVLTAAFLFVAQRRVFQLVKMLLTMRLNRQAALKA
ncbi:hypothetical protein QFC21_001654 [Naganishia friedmannii]|uniref:Uncharacterized protein n=1 Tax=Naganishia friedmannii TaxID=89922 RepID=A0ACC2W2J6_9TREE|nr:hypothetical protein QFC21_001654 [Naganishia friedmannii]